MIQKRLKAMVMAAGLGTRLEPLTLIMPKPLIPVMNRPLMDIILSNLSKIGVREVISNTHYLSHRIINRYKENDLGIKFNYITEKELSGTAGGVKKCQFFFEEGEDFIVISGDVLTNADIKKGIEIHKKSGAIATIGVKQIDKSKVSHFGVVVTDDDGFITEFQEKPPVEEAKSNFINTGIYIFNYKIFDYIPEDTFYDFAKNVFPKLLKEKQINTFEITEYWNDLGTIEQYKKSVQDVFNGECEIGQGKNIKKTNYGRYVCGKTKIPENIKIEGNCVIGDNCKIGNYVKLKNCIVMNNSEIAAGAELSDCIVIPEKEGLNRGKAFKDKQKIGLSK